MPVAARLAGALAGLTGWRRAAATLLLGGLATLAMPPWYALPLLLVGFTGLIWLLDGADATPRPLRRAVWTGFGFGFAYFAVGTWWIADAFLVDPARFGWMIPFALGGLSALLGLFPAVACLAAVWLRRRFAIGGAGRVLLLAACWVFLEWVRSWILTGFPWNLVGYAWSFAPAMTQSAAVYGVFGLSLVTVVAAAMPAVLGDPVRLRRTRVAFAIAALLLPALFVGGWLRLADAPSYAEPATGAPANPALVDGVRLRLVQAGIPQRLKWRTELRRAHLMRYLALSRTPAPVPPTDVIWPETAVPYFLADDPAAREIAARAAPPGGLLLAGTVRYEGATADDRRYFNSAIAIDGEARVLAVYDKVHLVPFGEYVPLGDVLPIERLVAGAGDFTAGPAHAVIDLAGLPPVEPLICYEAIFPGAIGTPDRRPEWLLNLTNDGWFGTGPGPRQHLAIATMRAVEEGLPLVRAAGTGISAVVDPYGRELARLDIGAVGVLDSPLPRALAPTIFALHDETIPALLIAAVLFSSLLWKGAARDNDI